MLADIELSNRDDDQKVLMLDFVTKERTTKKSNNLDFVYQSKSPPLLHYKEGNEKKGK